MDLYLHSLIRLHGVVLNLAQGKLPLAFKFNFEKHFCVVGNCEDTPVYVENIGCASQHA
jgi:hypothetical protein